MKTKDSIIIFLKQSKLDLLWIKCFLLVFASLFIIQSIEAQTIDVLNGTTQTGCSFTIFDSGDSSGQYDANEDYTVTICSGTTDYVQLNFVSFDTESGFDYLYVYDGSNTSSPQVSGSPFSGSTLPSAIESTGTCITIRFTSDGTVFGDGFELNATCVVPPPTYLMTDGSSVNSCVGFFTDPQGIAGYDDNNDVWAMTFCSGTGEAVKFDFSEFETSEANDYLSIFDGSNISAPLFGTYNLANSPGIVISSGTCLTFEWGTDNNGDGATGWLLQISCVPLPPDNENCDDADQLVCGTVDLAGTTISTSSQTHGSSCSISNYGVWYTFTGDGAETTITSTADFDHEMAISSGSCASLTNIACVDVTNGTESFTFTPSLGTDYYIYMAHYDSSSSLTGDFTISRSDCAVDMSYVSATTTQSNTSAVTMGSVNQQIIGITVETSGELNPLDLTGFVFRTDGSDSYSTDISNLNVWYTGANSQFLATNIFGTTQAPASPGTDIVFTGSQQLIEGTNYFWLTYDINDAATAGNVVDAICNSVIIDGNSNIPVVTSPVGSREIIDGCYYTLLLSDSYGDGWNGATISVNVDGVEVISDLTCAGYSTEYSFIAQSGAVISTDYIAGSYPSENSYLITNPNDAYVLSSGEAGEIPINKTETADCDAIKEFTVNGTAQQIEESCFILTEDKTNQAGSLWNNFKIDLTQNFTIDFDIYLGSNNGADGIVFALQGECTTAGANGGELGFGGIANSLAVEFDTYQNSLEWSDPVADHIAIISNGSVDHAATSNLDGPYDLLSDIEDDSWHAVSIEWIYSDANSQTLRVSFESLPILSYSGNIIDDIFGGSTESFWGLTGSTGAEHNLQKVCINSFPQNSTQLLDVTIQLGNTVDVIASSGANSYSWIPDDGSVSDPSSPNPTLSPDETTQYTCLIEDGCGNIITNKFTIFVENTLPIELAFFNAECYNNQILVNWQTLTETNNDFFTLQASYETDNFETIAIIDGAGNSNTVKNYSMEIENSGIPVFLRLKQTDYDLNETYSNVVSLHCDKIVSDCNVEVCPNPADEYVQIMFDKSFETESQVFVYDIFGKELFNSKLMIGESQIRLDLSDFASGIYFGKIINEYLDKSFKIVKN
ncbi:MAG: T9SS type A sorting domain-containing protein [Bacteroidales bacterium]|nr:T9SS type A sorting domain-containing protein [Bacteroidales bacterium]